ncbi:MAG: YdeI/OmpD-associated family protein, partial [Planctomycetes bacterium]|nr:YdeI/OmpD-associated family protein [Planctomycetota bacterium]
CYGWIDGQMQRIDAGRYKKYFARRTAASKWSDKNKKLVETLLDRGLVARPGLQAIEDAKKRGEWDKPERGRIDAARLDDFIALVKPFEPAYSHLLAMPKSVRTTYAGFYFDAKQEKTRQARLKRIVERLDNNLKPM